ncbi:MAG: hypothetical protein JWL72_1193 [Ilumatobacteraceae bacterium]|nr:hypothetical protein [Ilumatobacteraceae bacterium]
MSAQRSVQLTPEGVEASIWHLLTSGFGLSELAKSDLAGMAEPFAGSFAVGPALIVEMWLNAAVAALGAGAIGGEWGDAARALLGLAPGHRGLPAYRRRASAAAALHVSVDTFRHDYQRNLVRDIAWEVVVCAEIRAHFQRQAGDTGRLDDLRNDGYVDKASLTPAPRGRNERGDAVKPDRDLNVPTYLLAPPFLEHYKHAVAKSLPLSWSQTHLIIDGESLTHEDCADHPGRAALLVAVALNRATIRLARLNADRAQGDSVVVEYTAYRYPSEITWRHG